MRDQYLQLIERMEFALSHQLVLDDVHRLLHTDRYWHVLDMDSATPRPYPLVNAEIESRMAALTEAADELAARIALWSGPEGWHTTVLDTNVLVRVEPPWQVPWPQIVGRDCVRLVIPLRVIEELEKLKYTNDTKVRQVVRKLVPQLESKLLDNGSDPIRLDPKITLEVPVEPGLRDRPIHADEEILTTCESILQFTGRQELTLVTDDTGMHLQARARGIATKRVPDEFKRTLDEVSDPS